MSDRTARHGTQRIDPRDNIPNEKIWRLEITPPQPGDQIHVERTVAEWAGLHQRIRPAVEATPGAGYGGRPGYTITAPGDAGATPTWLRSLHDYLWGCGHYARITNDVDYYTDTDGKRWRKHDVYGGPHGEPPEEG